jgi:hypothetical protein
MGQKERQKKKNVLGPLMRPDRFEDGRKEWFPILKTLSRVQVTGLQGRAQRQGWIGDVGEARVAQGGQIRRRVSNVIEYGKSLA